MITGKPDLTLNLARLEQEIQAFKQEVNTREKWHIREKYVDRCQLSPYYIILFTGKVDEKGDDLMKEPLFHSRYPSLKFKYITRQPGASNDVYDYWQPISQKDMIERLDRFLNMYREDYLQPPGYRSDRRTPDQQHPRFKNKRFLYYIKSPTRSIVGIGSKKFALLGNFGGIRGTVYNEKKKPLEGTVVDLISKAVTLRRTTDKDGCFWFSRVPVGSYKLIVSGSACTVKKSIEKPGNIRGRLFSSEGKVLSIDNIECYAPDDECFDILTDSRGRFAFHYLVEGHHSIRKEGSLVAKE